MCSVFHLLPFQETCREPSASGRVEVVTQLAQQTGIRSTWAVYSWHQTKIVKGPGKNSVYSREVKWCLFQGWQLVKGQPEGGHHCAEGGQWTSFQTCPMNGPNQRIEQGFYQLQTLHLRLYITLVPRDQQNETFSHRMAPFTSYPCTEMASWEGGGKV